MERTIDYRITSDQSPISVKDFLKSKGYSTQNLIRLKNTTGCIKVNHIPERMNDRLSTDDLLTVHIVENESSPNIVPVEYPLQIVYEDPDILVLNKPAGLPIHPSQNHYDHSLANALAWHYQAQCIPFVFRCINRLDKDTSGLTIVAKHSVSAGILGTMVSEKKTLSREYLAIVKGTLPQKSGSIDAPIARKEGSIIERQVDFEKGEHALTHYSVLKEENGYSLISLKLETGRTHQIRVHMKYLGYPLIGDYLYNPDNADMSRQALHSYRLAFVHPMTGQPMEFTAPLPEDMHKLFPTW